jgi:hypothetical protein
LEEPGPGEEDFRIALVELAERRFSFWGLGFEEMGDEFDGITREKTG